MFFQKPYFPINASALSERIRAAVAAEPKRKLTISISKRYAEEHFLPVEIDGKPEKIRLDYSGELLKVVLEGGDTVLLENASDGLLAVVFQKLRDMGKIKQSSTTPA